LRESHYGRFTVNLGVALPAVRAIESGRESPVFVQECECAIRQRLTRLAYNEDAWFDLDHQVSKTTNDITRYMDSLGLPFLEEFESYDAVLAVYPHADSVAKLRNLRGLIHRGFARTVTRRWNFR
jgi:hypothetical protein